MACRSLHIVWGRVDVPSHATGGSSRPRAEVANHRQDLDEVRFEELSSSSSSESLGMQESLAACGTASGPGGAAEQGSKPALAGGPPEFQEAIRSQGQHLRRAHLDEPWKSSTGDSDLQASGGAAPSVGPPGSAAALLDSVSMWSRGSMLHQRGACRPCHYVQTKRGCLKGRDCSFCHLPHTGNPQHRPCKARRRQCHLLATLLDEQQPGELRRLAAGGVAGEAIPERSPTPQGLARWVQQIASRSPYMRKFITKHWPTLAPAEAPQPTRAGAASGAQACNSRSAEGAEGRKSPVQQ